MPHKMRRTDREMQPADARELLERGEYGVLSTADAAGIPYGVPLSYAVIGGDIYFHCALEGRKLENLSAQASISFCVVGAASPVDPFSMRYESVIVEGIAAAVTGDGEKTRALLALCRKYFPGKEEAARMETEESLSRTAVYKIEIQQISGKRRA